MNQTKGNENSDKYNLRDILIRNKGFTPQMLQELTHKIDIILKVEYMKLCQTNE